MTEQVQTEDKPNPYNAKKDWHEKSAQSHDYDGASVKDIYCKSYSKIEHSRS